MAKKVFLGLILLTIVIFAAVFYFSGRTEKTFRSPVVDQKKPPTNSKPNQTLRDQEKTYQDPAGFSFSYPARSDVNQIKTSDQSVYSSLEIVSKNRAGKITLTAVTSPLTKIEDYFIKKKVERRKLKIADMEAGQYEEKGKIITVGLDQGVLFTIAVDYKNDKNYWDSVNKKLVTSFAFELPEAANPPAGDRPSEQGDDVIYEGEEEIN